MEPASQSQMRQVREGIYALESERDDLDIKLTYAQSTIFALLRQIRELDMVVETQAELLKRAESLLDGINSNPNAASTPSASPLIQSSTRSTGTDWIGGNWLIIPANNYLLGPTEAAWKQGKTQEALNLLTAVLKRDDLDPAEEIEVNLLLAAIIRSSGHPKRALEFVEKALRLSDEFGLVEVVGKIQYHRGLCFLYLSNYTDASWCFVLASSTEGHAQQVEAQWEVAEKKRMETCAMVGISKAL